MGRQSDMHRSYRSPKAGYVRRERNNYGLINVKGVVKRVVDVQDEEVEMLIQGFGAFFCILASYFLLLPSRDEAGVALGNHLLPYLFLGSFLLTLLVTPFVSDFLVRPGVSSERSVQQLYRLLALSLLGFAVAYILTATPAGRDHPPGEEGALRRHRLGKSGKALPLPAQNHTERRSLLGLGLAQHGPRGGDTSLTLAQRLVRGGFFLWLSLLNLVSLSTIWARMAEVFGSHAGRRLFGFLGAGATCGQLVGSLMATLWASALGRWGSSGHYYALPTVVPLLAAAALLEAAGRGASRLRRVGMSPSPAKPLRSPVPKAGQGHGSVRKLSSMLGHSWDGLRVIAASGYLTHLSVYIILATVIASLMYFEKSMVVASAAGDSASRMAIFASINSASALVIATLQLAATGRVLKRLGVACSLAASPAFAAGLMTCIAVWPTPFVVALGEVLRKVVGYSLAKPAKEVLFTVVPREDMYRAKLCIDTLVVRGGDVLAAAAFHILEGLLHFGPVGCAAAATPICLACTAVAYSLGRKQEVLAQQGADAGAEVE